MADALPLYWKAVVCDTSEEYTSIARRYWREAGVEDRIDLRIGPAVATLDQMISSAVRDSSTSLSSMRIRPIMAAIMSVS